MGTSGWVYDNWRPGFYPVSVPRTRWLAHYASKFPSVEVNGTFYSLARPGTFEKWRAEVPAGFRFALKGSRYITHMLKLRGVEALANFFAQGVLLLGEQLGPVLWQLPERLAFDEGRARSFFAALPRDLEAAERLARRHDHRLEGRAATRAPDGRDRPIRHALEVRHASWLVPRALELLREHEVALVAADTADRFPAPLERTAPLAYVRLHGRRRLYSGAYTDLELDLWARRIQKWRRDGAEVHVYFDNTDREGSAPFDARALLARLEPGRHSRRR